VSGEIRILGIDPSMSCSGWALIDGEANVIECGTERDREHERSVPERINAMAWRLADVVKRLAPTHVYAGEPLIHNARGKSISLIKLAGAVGFGAHDRSNRALTVTGIHDVSARRIVGFKPTKVKGEKDNEREQRLKAEVFTFAVLNLKGATFTSVDAAEAGIFALAGLKVVKGEATLTVPKKARKKREGGERKSKRVKLAVSAKDPTG